MQNKKNPKILVVSDVHLGAMKSKLGLFHKYLENIKDEAYGRSLKALIILGDFFDLCTELPKTLLDNTNIAKILNLLLEIRDTLKISLIFVLGNHEIPVTGNYNKKFNQRKKKFLKKFEDSNYATLFKEESFCQYVLLRKQNGSDTLCLYDSKKDIYNSPVDKIIIDNLELGDEFKCLMMHGFQFDSNFFRFLAGTIWRSLIKSDDIDIKEAFDYLWNGVIKKGKRVKSVSFNDMKKKITKTKGPLPGHFSNMTTLEFSLFRLDMRILEEWEKARKIQYYHEGIKSFFDNKLSSINNVIYGHSHNSGSTVLMINSQEVNTINDGAWQHVDPTIVEIRPKGKIKAKSLPILISP